MLKVKCVQKFRGKDNSIRGYRIIDQYGNAKDISSEELKKSIRLRVLEVINLTLTSDNRLIDKGITQTPTQQTPTQQTQKPIKQSHQKIIDIAKIVSKLKLLGCVIEIDEGCDHTIYLIKMSKEDYMLIIPDDVTEIKFNTEDTPISRILNRILIELSKAKLIVCGGNNLKTAKSLFKKVTIGTIDLRAFNTSNMTNMQYMFSDCRATSIYLSNFDTSKVTDMSGMFSDCEATSLDLSSFNTSNVTKMERMFSGCKATSLDLSSFDTSKVTDMRSMFNSCNAKSIDLSSFDTSNVTDMSAMFMGCELTSLDLSNFDMSKVITMGDIFFHSFIKDKRFGGNKDLELELQKAWESL